MHQSLTASNTSTTLAYVYQLKKLVGQHKVLFVHEGYYTEGLVKQVLGFCELLFEQASLHSTHRRKLQNLMVEMLQNLTRHSEEINNQEDKAIFMLTQDEAAFSVITGNLINAQQAHVIERKIESINTLTLEEIRQSYLNQASRIDISPKGGAGLGFLDMARKSGNALKYDLLMMEQDVYFFVLKTTVNV